MKFVVDATAKHDVYNLLIGLVAPRPIALVTSLNEDGGVNAAPYSSYNYMAIEPPMVGLGLAERDNPGRGAEGDRQTKDTGRNIRRSGEFVVNVVTEDLLEAMNVTGIDFPAEVSEVAEARLHLADSSVVSVPRLAEAHAALECVEHQTILSALKATRWRIHGPEGAAARLGINAFTLTSRLRRMGLARHGEVHQAFLRGD